MKVGILNSGGDVQGINAVIASIVRASFYAEYDYEFVGFKKGWEGILDKDYMTLDMEAIRGISHLGGTILHSVNKGRFSGKIGEGSVNQIPEEILREAKDNLDELGVEALIVIGGDGTLSAAIQLAEHGIKIIGVPKTIDNDLGCTEISVGFDTAVTVATEALDRLQPTAASHDRVMILEVMGRDAGHIALNAGIAGGADVILIPEIPYSMEAISKKIQSVKENGRNFALVIVSEAVKDISGEVLQKEFSDGQKRLGGIGDYLGDKIAEATGSETRVTVLGHIQRGGQPTYHDRMIATAFGVRAVDLIKDEQYGRMVAWQNRQVVDVPIEDAIATYQDVDVDGALVHTARALGICLGDEG